MVADRLSSMEELCSKSAYDDADLQEKIDRFLSDRSIDTVTGIRRMGRDNLVDFIAERCIASGRTCSIFPDVSSSDVILFRQWSNMDKEMKEIVFQKPGIDILFGQDLCHQVPAIVRYNVKEK